MFPIIPPAFAVNVEEYVKETEKAINKIRDTINIEKNDPYVATAMAGLREASNSWVAKYRREKALLSRILLEIFTMLSMLFLVIMSVLEEMETAKKALLRGRAV